MEGLGDHLFAGAVFAGDEDVGVGGADAAHQVEHGLHGGGAGDEVGCAFSAEDAVFGFEPGGALLGAVELELGAEDCEETEIVPGFLDEVVGAAAHGFDGKIDRAPGGHQDDGDLRIVAADGGEQVEAFLAGGGVAGVVEVDDDAVERGGGDALEDHGRGACALEEVALGSEEKLERVEDLGLVVGDEETAGVLVGG